MTTFPNDDGYDELIVARAVPFVSLCQHHLLAFAGKAHVGYLPGGRILGLSKLARVVELFSRDLQIQERMTQQIANWLRDNLQPRGVGVVVEPNTNACRFGAESGGRAMTRSAAAASMWRRRSTPETDRPEIASSTTVTSCSCRSKVSRTYF